MNAAAPKISREAYFSLLWAHASGLFRESMCALSGIERDRWALDWCHLSDSERARVGNSLDVVLSVHQDAIEKERGWRKVPA